MLKIRLNKSKDSGFRVFVLLTAIIIFVSIGAAQSFTESGGQVSATTGDYSVSTEGVRSGVDWLELNGSVSGLSDVNDSIRFGFEYREAGSSTWNEVFGEAQDSSGDFQRRVEGLNSDTEYEFRAVSLEHDRNGSVFTKFTLPGVFTKSGGTTSFSTQDYSVSTGEARSGVDWLELNGSVSGFSDLNDSVRFGFEYREEGSSTWKDVFAESKDTSGSFYRRVEGLNPDTNYEYRAASLEHERNGSVNTKVTLPGVFTKSGGSVSFQTKDYTINTTEAVSGTNYLDLRGELSGIDSGLQDPIALYFDYRPEGSSTWNSVQATSRTNNGFFEERVEGLENGTNYEFRASSEHDKTGNILTKQTLPGVFTKSGGVVSFATGPAFDVSIESLNDPVFVGGDVRVEALVENTGASGQSYVNLSIPGLGQDSTQVDLTDGESQFVNFNIPTSEGDSGTYTVNVSSSTDEVLDSVSVASLESPVDPLPLDGSEPVGLDQDISAEANATADVNMTLEFYLNSSGTPEKIGNVSDVAIGERANISLSGHVDPGTEYDWFAYALVPGEQAYSQEWSFTTVERPEITSISPIDGAAGLDENPELQAEVDGNSDINISIYNYENPGSALNSGTVSPGESLAASTSGEEIGDGTPDRWYVTLEALGAQWNNSEDPYEFTVSNISEVDYSLQEFESGQNLNPGNFGGLEVIGKEELEFKVSNPEDQLMDFKINLSNGMNSDIKTVADVSSGGTISANINEDFSLDVTENTDSYELQAFLVEGETDFTQDKFSSNLTEFSTYVSKINWSHPGNDVQEFGIYYNESNTDGEKVFVGSVDESVREVGVANRRLSSNSEPDCYQVEARNPFGGTFVQNPSNNCLGSQP